MHNQSDSLLLPAYIVEQFRNMSDKALTAPLYIYPDSNSHNPASIVLIPVCLPELEDCIVYLQVHITF